MDGHDSPRHCAGQHYIDSTSNIPAGMRNGGVAGTPVLRTEQNTEHRPAFLLINLCK